MKHIANVCHAPFESHPDARLNLALPDRVDRIVVGLWNVKGALLDCVGKGVGVAAGTLGQLGAEGHNRLGVLASRAGDDDRKQARGFSHCHTYGAWGPLVLQAKVG